MNWRMGLACLSSARGEICYWNVPECGSLSTWLRWYLNSYCTLDFLWLLSFGLVLLKAVSSSAIFMYWLLQKSLWSLLQNVSLPLENSYSHDKLDVQFCNSVMLTKNCPISWPLLKKWELGAAQELRLSTAPPVASSVTQSQTWCRAWLQAVLL